VPSTGKSMASCRPESHSPDTSACFGSRSATIFGVGFARTSELSVSDRSLAGYGNVQVTVHHCGPGLRIITDSAWRGFPAGDIGKWSRFVSVPKVKRMLTTCMWVAEANPGPHGYVVFRIA
jgi:hypothetical protein